MHQKNIEKSQRKRSGFVSAIISWIIHLMLMVILAWVILWVILMVYSLNRGVDAAYHRIHVIAVENETLLKTVPLFNLNNADELFQHLARECKLWLAQQRYVNKSMQYIKKKREELSDHIGYENIKFKKSSALLETFKQFFDVMVRILFGAGMIVIERMFIFMLSIPLFLLCLSLGAIDGLVQRDIRKFQSARESTLLFHEIKRSAKFFYLIPIMVYFALPWPLSPVWFLVPTAMLMGVLTQLSLRSFKKYL